MVDCLRSTTKSDIHVPSYLLNYSSIKIVLVSLRYRDMGCRNISLFFKYNETVLYLCCGDQSAKIIVLKTQQQSLFCKNPYLLKQDNPDDVSCFMYCNNFLLPELWWLFAQETFGFQTFYLPTNTVYSLRTNTCWGWWQVSAANMKYTDEAPPHILLCNEASIYDFL